MGHSAGAYKRDPRVDEYIGQLPAWQQEICQGLRELIHRADPEVIETIKRTVQPYFVLDGTVCALLAAKDHVTLSTTAPSSPTRQGSSQEGMTTRPRGRSPTTKVARSNPAR